MNAFERAHIRDIALRNQKIEQAINDAVKDIGRRFTTVNGKRFASIMTGRLNDLHDQILNDGKDGIRNQWMMANTMNNKGLDGYLASVKISDSINQSFRAPNLSALNAFIDRTEKGMNLSERVWNFTDGVKDSMEGLIKAGVLEGKSAITLSKELKGFINGKPIRYEGGLIPAKNLNFQAIRLAATEMNMAFRTSDYLQNSRLPFTTGVTVHLSGAHPETDICDELQGEYPKGFQFTGWHPLCYDNQTEVYTSEGWKYFKDLSDKEQILSLNPDTKDLEWTSIVRQVKYEYHSDMIRFYGHSLDMMVTPDHKIVGYDRHNGKYREMSASEFYDKMTFIESRNIYTVPLKLYRSSEWIGKNPEFIQVGKYQIPTEVFTEFMAYYLSDGSTSRKYAVVISQWKEVSQEQYETISQCLDKLPFGHSKKHNGFFFYDKDLWEYLSQFGKAHEKYIPEEIKGLSSDYIKIFLDAYTICDGHIRIGRLWKGGNFSSERTFMTSSKRLADDIGELLLKIGHHPSFAIGSKKGTVVKHYNGEYTQNNDCIVIRDCRSQYATQFNREKVPYTDFVYDVEVEKNHIIYIRRNGKCLWSSNCICYTTYDTMPAEEFVKYIQTGEINQSRFTTDINPAARQYLERNGDRLMGYKNPPYWLSNFDKNLNLREVVQTPIMAESVPMVPEEIPTRGHISEITEKEITEDIIKQANLNNVMLDEKQAKFMRESMRRWGGAEYVQIREYQQTGKIGLRAEKDIAKVSDAVEKYIDIMPKYNGDIVYRNINIGYESKEYKLFSKIPNGSVINMEGTNSWTSSEHLYSTSRNVQFVLEKPKTGVSIQHLTGKISEEEVIYSKKSRFVVTKVEEIKSGSIKEIKQVAKEDDTMAMIFGTTPEPEITINKFDKLIIHVKEIENVR